MPITSFSTYLQPVTRLPNADFVLNSYGTTIFSSIGIDNSFITQIILGSVNVVCTFPGLYMVEKFGRRKCLTIGALWMCMCFLVFASLGNFKLYNADGSSNQTIGYVMIVFASLFIAAFASTWGPMAWACVAEMYPGKYRSQGIAFCSASNWVCSPSFPPNHPASSYTDGLNVVLQLLSCLFHTPHYRPNRFRIRICLRWLQPLRRFAHLLLLDWSVSFLSDLIDSFTYAL